MTNDTNKLIEDNINIANKLAWQYYNKFNRKIEFEELQSLSYFGLTKAANTFDNNLKYAFSTYAYKCIINELLLFYRNNKKHFASSLSMEVVDENISLQDLIAVDYKAEELIYSNLEKAELYKFINELSKNECLVINYILQGKKMGQIAKFLNCSQPQISRIYHKALHRLRDKFSNYGKEEL